MTELTFLSYNIHHGEGRDGVVNLQRLADIITSVCPDLAALQEVDRNLERTGFSDQVAEFSELTGMNTAFSISIDNGHLGLYGNLVLSRHPILKSKTYRLPGEPRSLLETHIDLSGSYGVAEPLLFYATHLDLEQKHRLVSAHKIRKIITSFPGRCAVLAGDLNAVPDSPTLRYLLQFLHPAADGRESITYVGEDGTEGRQIDHILFRPGHRWQVIETKVINDSIASDHFPLIARLHLKS